MSHYPLFHQSIDQRLKKLNFIVAELEKIKSIAGRLEFLSQLPEVVDFLATHPFLKNKIPQLNISDQYILKSLLALEQGPIIFQNIEQHTDPDIALKELLEKLAPVEKFYEMTGGIIGYHTLMMQLLLEKKLTDYASNLELGEKYHQPPGYDIENDNAQVRKAVRRALEELNTLAEIYPAGGAGDRLNLIDAKTGEALPAAELIYDGRTLLEGLIRDLQAREYLYFKLFGKEILTPIAIMTSDEKNNYQHIISICERNKWFGRPSKSYQFFKQPLVPVLTELGIWAVREPLQLLFKPGGHGVLWKLALDAGIIDRLLQQGVTKALVRQINNPISGSDYGLLAFCGYGILNGHSFGFASCPRLLNTAEGMNVLVEKKIGKLYEYCISNIEYPDFIKKHIKDVSEKPGSPFSAFPANTNILFVNLNTIREAIQRCPLPGVMINMKSKVSFLLPDGNREEVLAGRLETLMQNIADVITDKRKTQNEDFQPEELHTYLTYNTRRKTISVTKKLSIEGGSIVETPEGSYYDQLANHHELFTKHCQMSLPKMPSEQVYHKKGPSFITSFHPALGPLYSIISQKIHGGSLSDGAELVLEIAELKINHLELTGSLLIYAEQCFGHKDSQGIIRYSDQVGRCILKNVKVINRGIDRQNTDHYWTRNIVRHEAFKVTLKGHSEFIAENVTLSGNANLVVEDGYRMIARESDGRIEFDVEPLVQPQWHLGYAFDESDRIILTYKAEKLNSKRNSS